MIGDAIVPRELDGGIPVKWQDQITEPLDLYFIRSLGYQTTLSVPGVVDTYEITVADTTGFVNGVYIGPAGNVLTIDTPMCCEFPAGTTNVLALTRDLNVDGSSTRQIFQIGPVGAPTGIEVDITNILFSITDNLAMDDSKFGGIAALSRGCVLRKNNHEYISYGNFKNNRDIILYSGEDIEYRQKAGGGNYGVLFTIPYSGPENKGVAIRLIPGDILELIIQDDLTDLVSFRATAQGHVVENRTMADPVLVDIPVAVWTKVATGVVTGAVLPVTNGPQYVYTLRDTTNPQPTNGDYTEAKALPWSGKEISASAPIDVYVSVSAGSDPGKVRVDL
jgi:hypothetical protein